MNSVGAIMSTMQGVQYKGFPWEINGFPNYLFHIYHDCAQYKDSSTPL